MDKSPFKNDSEILKFIPEPFRQNGSIDYAWFNTPPKFTAFRVNRMVTSAEDVISLIEEQLNKTANTYGITSIPEVGVHTTLPDCVIVGDWNGPSCNDNFNLNCYPEVIVDVLCACAVLRGANIFAPGILGMPHDANEGSIVGVYADLKGKCRRGYTQVFTEEKLFLGTGYVRMDRHTLFDNNASPRGIAVEMIDRISKIPNFTLPSEFGILQNLPSMLCSYMLDVNENTVVLDMCAAPGNKTTHIAALMGNKGTLIAIDKTRDKVERIKDLCDTLGLANVSAYVWDSTQAVSFGKDETENLPPLTAEYFDRILLDAPCSALGNRPQLMNNITVKQLQSYPILQKKLFRNAVKLLKVGGILVYSTCTITIEENENLVCWALDKFPELKLCKQTPMLGSPGFAQGKLTNIQLECLQRFGPPSSDKPEQDTIGFFMAKFEKFAHSE